MPVLLGSTTLATRNELSYDIERLALALILLVFTLVLASVSVSCGFGLSGLRRVGPQAKGGLDGGGDREEQRGEAFGPEQFAGAAHRRHRPQRLPGRNTNAKSQTTGYSDNIPVSFHAVRSHYCRNRNNE